MGKGQMRRYLLLVAFTWVLVSCGSGTVPGVVALPDGKIGYSFITDARESSLDQDLEAYARIYNLCPNGTQTVAANTRPSGRAGVLFVDAIVRCR